MDKGIIKPHYFDTFECIGGACEDTCCAGWQILIDRDTYAKYKKVKDDAMKRRLNKEVVEKKGTCDNESVAKIKLKNNRCAFLTKDGWCDIYSQLGSDYLSHTCELYPRTMNKVADRVEYSLTTSCPEATRKILGCVDGIQFIEEVGDVKPKTISATIALNNEATTFYKASFLQIRKLVIAILQFRGYPFEDRLEYVGHLLNTIDAIAEHKDRDTLLTYLEEQENGFKNYNAVEDKIYLEGARKQLELAIAVKQLFKEKKMRMERYNEFLQDVLDGLALQEKIVFSEVRDAYEKGEKLYYQPFLMESGYMLENYFVNYVFERCMPLDGLTPMASYRRMLLYYHLIKIHLIGIANNRAGIDEATMVTCIQLFTKTYDHGENYIEKLIVSY